MVSHRPAPEIRDRQTLITTGVGDAVAAAREAAGDKDVALMGGGVVTEARRIGLVDELILHQVPILLSGGRSFFQELPEHVQLHLLEVIPAYSAVSSRGPSAYLRGQERVVALIEPERQTVGRATGNPCEGGA